jgi:hypothetical protein
MYAQKVHFSFPVSDASLLPSFCAVIVFSLIVFIMHLPFICTTFRAWTFPAHFRPTPYFLVSLKTFIATVDRLCSVQCHISLLEPKQLPFVVEYFQVRTLDDISTVLTASISFLNLIFYLTFIHSSVSVPIKHLDKVVSQPPLCFPIFTCAFDGAPYSTCASCSCGKLFADAKASSPRTRRTFSILYMLLEITTSILPYAPHSHLTLTFLQHCIVTSAPLYLQDSLISLVITLHTPPAISDQPRILHWADSMNLPILIASTLTHSSHYEPTVTPISIPTKPPPTSITPIVIHRTTSYIPMPCTPLLMTLLLLLAPTGIWADPLFPPTLSSHELYASSHHTNPYNGTTYASASVGTAFKTVPQAASAVQGHYHLNTFFTTRSRLPMRKFPPPSTLSQMQNIFTTTGTKRMRCPSPTWTSPMQRMRPSWSSPPSATPP